MRRQVEFSTHGENTSTNTPYTDPQFGLKICLFGFFTLLTIGAVTQFENPKEIPVPLNKDHYIRSKFTLPNAPM